MDIREDGTGLSATGNRDDCAEFSAVGNRDDGTGL